MRPRQLATRFLALFLLLGSATACGDTTETVDPCEGVECSGKGACDVVEGEAVCVCEAGYEGEACESCTAGYAGEACDTCAAGYVQWPAEGGACVVDPCEPDPCARPRTVQGSCEQTGESTFTCTCDAGWDGAACDTCAPGYHPDGTDACVADVACDEDSCSGNGACDDASGVPVCTCDAGYQGATCDACADGYHDEAGACVADVACGDDSCSGNGACDDTTGVPVCTCDAGYQGAACDECAAGYHDEAGACVADVTCGANTCNSHGTCDDASGVPVCTCDAGYQGAACDTCADGYHTEAGACVADVPCAANTCNSHGTCEDASGVPVCTCDPAYQGAACDTCADGYHDEAGACVADVPCTANTCSGHGACDDTSGVPVCTCEAGYQGATCDACADGYHEEAGACVADVTCGPNTCNSHGTCDDTSGVPVCTCDPGYQGAACDTCADGYHDEAGACVADVACAANTCSGHGTCDDASGVPVCTCDPAYQGAACDACADGYHDEAGACVADVACAANTCNSHGTCDDTAGVPVCACDAAYQGAACDTCADGYHDEAGACVVDTLPGDGTTCASPLALDLSAGTVSGTNTGAGDEYDGSCQSNNGEEVVYVFTTTQTLDVAFQTTGFDTVLYLRSDCLTPSSEIACNDDETGLNLGSRIEATLPAGTYYLFVDAFSSNGGTYTLEIEVSCGAGSLYDPVSGGCVADPCAPNPCTDATQAICNVVSPTTYECLCSPGHIPDPTDPTACILDSNPSGESCAGPIPLTAGVGQVTGTTADAVNDGRGSCAGDGPDRIYSVTLTERMRVQLDMTGYDTALHIRSTCSDAATQLVCDDDGGAGTEAQITTTLDAGTYYVWADSYSNGDAYTLAYDFRADPCAGDPCPGTPECVASGDWSSFECVCPPGTLPYQTGCVADPCEPNPCTAAHETQCQPVLPASHTCQCDPGYIDDGAGSCVVDPNANEWTVIVYLNADNNLESYGYSDLAEMEVAGSNAYVNIVVLFDSYTQDGGDARTLYVNQGSSTTLINHGEIDMGDWTTLRDFGVWAIQNYPARHYALVMWNHGEGWRLAPTRSSTSPLKAFSNDDHGSMDGISVANGDYAAALQAISATAGGKLDLVGFDACLMGMYEVAHATAPYADYLVASSETEPADGWTWDGFLPQLVATPQMPASQLGTLIVDSYHATSTQNVTLALTDLGTLGQLDAAVTTFANELVAAQSAYADIDNLRQQSESFDYGSNRDLMDFAQRVAGLASAPQSLKNAANALKTQLQATIVHNQAHTTYPGSNGLAVYFPGRSSSVESDYSGASWSQASTWDDFLLHFTTH